MNNHHNELGVIKVKDLMTWNNCLFVLHHLSEYLPDAFASYHHTTNEHQNPAITGAQKCFWMYTWKEMCTMDQTLSCSIFDWNNIIKKIIYNPYMGRAQFLTKVNQHFDRGITTTLESVICILWLYSHYTFYSLFSPWIIKL